MSADGPRTAAAQGARTLPTHFPDVEALEDFMTAPSQALVDDLARVDGDIMVLGVGGKMGPTLARMAKRAAPGKRVIGVARFSERGLAERLAAQGIECIACDLMDTRALEQLPRVRNIVFMAGHKFGASGNTSFTWAMNAGMPYVAADVFRDSRIVVFSTACVYPFVDVAGPGADEGTPALPPPGDYAASCVGREKMFENGSIRWGTPGRLVRLSYAIDMRYGVLHDIASAVAAGEPLDVTMGHANVIWQGDANEQALRLLAHCTAPATPINLSGPRIEVRAVAAEFGRRLGRAPVIVGNEAPTAWVVDVSESQRLLGAPSVSIDTMIEWVAEWVSARKPSLGKATKFQTRDGKY